MWSLKTQQETEKYAQHPSLMDKEQHRQAAAQKGMEAHGDSFIQAIREAQLEPTKKYHYPQTESQEMDIQTTGVMSVKIADVLRPLFAQIVSDRSDRRLNFPRRNTEITKYMDAAWRLKEQTQNLS
ncbi:unnamed protein product [Merluccius merluccius]